MTLTIDLPNDLFEKLAGLAHTQGVSVEECARQELGERLSRERAIVAASEYVLRKNAELYRRLAQ
ncbi:MAG TPA: DNA-binding protein [Fimbriiglobus sp.]|jgi:predicted transcriptional regulator